ncbi:DUF4124 domain-containing protein [Lysobacter sp. LF1]|uniref:DUF4124 domain-containing protein n=1 Tax=Lysobacter stagni TaxID=3045172 RepID=A0ABT6XDY4_9GAMM|nr:DUF4124 domain-containing protein [Lysobacter sp. LF1]MDI9238356.1 DUF4124 domain-containing protein [Lysobacter sp. LF1]
MRAAGKAPRRAFVAMMGLLACMAMAPASAQVVIYRCTDASGAVTLQSGTPCAKGSKQQKRVMETPQPPAFVPAPAIVAPAPAPAPAPMDVPTPPTPTPVAEIVEAPRQPPPALYECRTWDKQRYLSEDAQPPPRCAPLQVTGLDGQGDSAGGLACQRMEDQCQRIPDARLCEAWQQRLHDAQAASAFGAPDSPDPRPVDVAHVRGILEASNCAP